MNAGQNMRNQAGSRLLMLDLIKAYSIVAVIMTHVADIPRKVKMVCLWPFTITLAVPVFLMCSVYVFCLTEDRKQGTILSWFSTKIFWKRINRFLYPYLISVGVMLLGLVVFRDLRAISASSLFKILQQGGRGPGAYYVMVNFQLLVLFPFLRYAYKQNKGLTVLTGMVLYMAYEVLCDQRQLNSQLHQTLIFCYLHHLVLGLLLYDYAKELRGTAIPLVCMIIGAIYMINAYYLGNIPSLPFMNSLRSVIPALYSFGLLCVLLNLEEKLQYIYIYIQIRNLLAPILYIGKASFHIMLTQMVWFYFARMFNLEAQLGSWKIAALVDVAVCVSVGCLFFALDNISRKGLSRLVKVVRK